MSKYADMEKEVQSNAKKLERGFAQINEWLLKHNFSHVVKNRIEDEIHTIDVDFHIRWRNTQPSSNTVVYGVMKKDGGWNKGGVNME